MRDEPKSTDDLEAAVDGTAPDCNGAAHTCVVAAGRLRVATGLTIRHKNAERESTEYAPSSGGGTAEDAEGRAFDADRDVEVLDVEGQQGSEDVVGGDLVRGCDLVAAADCAGAADVRPPGGGRDGGDGEGDYDEGAREHFFCSRVGLEETKERVVVWATKRDDDERNEVWRAQSLACFIRFQRPLSYPVLRLEGRIEDVWRWAATNVPWNKVLSSEHATHNSQTSRIFGKKVSFVVVPHPGVSTHRSSEHVAS